MRYRIAAVALAALLVGVAIGFGGGVFKAQHVGAVGGWTFAQFEYCASCSPHTWYWVSGSSDWYGAMDTNQTINQFMATLPETCPVQMLNQGSSDDYMLLVFPTSC